MDIRALLFTPALIVLLLGLLSMGSNGRDSVSLQGEGSSFLYPQIQAWASEFTARNPGIIINYNPTGSGAGQSSFLKGVVDFAGSDPPLSRDVWEESWDRVVQMPVVIGMVAIVYNVPGVDELRLDGEVLALIYLGVIEYWDDERIRALNPGEDLPHERIIAVHRSDSSGTTQVFTLFLHKSAPDVWGEDLVGKSIEWPVDDTGRGIGGKGNQGVLEAIRSNLYSIGYVEYAYAIKNNMKTAAIMNREGEFIKPSMEAAQAAALGALDSIPDSPDGDWSRAFQDIVYAPGSGSYPITSWSFLLFYKSYNDPAKADAVRRFIQWINVEGQAHIVDGYIPVPAQVRQVNLKAVEMIHG
ncbi:MAG: phosphate ABC transporter substrate-binding protein PstS [Desulfurococcales archaeon]|nr:phosphate ABC transporter substrate-binding protein PstS [Desulfurococcales archaeon]